MKNTLGNFLHSIRLNLPQSRILLEAFGNLNKNNLEFFKKTPKMTVEKIL